MWLFSSVLQTKRFLLAAITNNFKLLLPFVQFIEVLFQVDAVGFTYHSIISSLSSKAIYTWFCIQVACLGGMKKEIGLISPPIKGFPQKHTITILPHGHRETHRELTKRKCWAATPGRKDTQCWVSLKLAGARMGPQTDVSPLWNTANITQTSLILAKLHLHGHHAKSVCFPISY